MKRWLGMVRDFIARQRLATRVGIGLAGFVGCVLGFVLSQRSTPTKTQAIGARLELAAGEVTVKDGSAWPTVISGTALRAGSELATGKGARALVRLSDGSSVFLRSESKIVMGQVRITLEHGEAWLDAPPSERGSHVHKIGDPTVSAADAGLSMRVSSSDVAVYVARGLAVVTSKGGRVEVNAGEQASIAGGSAPKVAPVAYWDDWTGGMGDHKSLSG